MEAVTGKRCKAKPAVAQAASAPSESLPGGTLESGRGAEDETTCPTPRASSAQAYHEVLKMGDSYPSIKPIALQTQIQEREQELAQQKHQGIFTESKQEMKRSA